jgi:hypothetical protein
MCRFPVILPELKTTRAMLTNQRCLSCLPTTKRARMRIIVTALRRELRHAISGLSFLPLASVLIVATAVPLHAQSSSALTGWTVSKAGSSAVYRPDSLQPGKTFVLTIPQPQPLAGQPLTAWFTVQVQADLEQRGGQTHMGNLQTNPDGTLLVAVPYKDRAGKSWTAIYAAATRPDGGQFCSMISDLPPQEMKVYIRSGATIFGDTVKQAHSVQNPSPSKDGNQSAGSIAMNTPSGNGVRAVPSGTGISDTQIKGIVHVGRGMTTPTGYQYVESVDLLLSDGWEYSDLTGPPEDLNVEASKKSEPQKWHHWRQQGGAIYLEVNGSWTKLDGDLVRPLESGSTLSKNLVHRTAHTFVGMGGTVGTDRISFHPNGRFERSANVLAGSGTVQASGGFSGGASSATNRNGTTSSSYGTHSGGGGSVTARSSHSTAGGSGAATGSYRISGYTLELDCTNGQVQRFLAFYPFPGKPQIFIGNTTFSVE